MVVLWENLFRRFLQFPSQAWLVNKRTVVENGDKIRGCWGRKRPEMITSRCRGRKKLVLAFPER